MGNLTDHGAVLILLSAQIGGKGSALISEKPYWGKLCIFVSLPRMWWVKGGMIGDIGNKVILSFEHLGKCAESQSSSGINRNFSQPMGA